MYNHAIILRFFLFRAESLLKVPTSKTWFFDTLYYARENMCRNDMKHPSRGGGYTVSNDVPIFDFYATSYFSELCVWRNAPAQNSAKWETRKYNVMTVCPNHVLHSQCTEFVKSTYYMIVVLWSLHMKYQCFAPRDDRRATMFMEFDCDRNKNDEHHNSMATWTILWFALVEPYVNVSMVAHVSTTDEATLNSI